MTFYLIDKVLKLVHGKNAEAVKCWSLDNPVFGYHFPGAPIVPGLLLTESVAQTLGILAEYSYYKEFDKTQLVYPVLSIVQKAKFRDFVKPGDKTIIKVELKSLDYHRANGSGIILVDDKKVMETTLSMTIARQEDMGTNPYLSKIQEFKHMVLSEIEL